MFFIRLITKLAILFILFVLIDSLHSEAEKDIFRIWKFVGIEIIICIFLNIVKWIYDSLKVGTFRNVSLLIAILSLIGYVFTASFWLYYKNNKEKCEAYSSSQIKAMPSRFASNKFSTSLKASICFIISASAF
ncbi:MAG TPA: hypothetical protein VIK78_16095 [Ruminiclostridium sp.]